MTPTQQGLMISLTGLIITFLALGGLIGLIYLLKWVFQVKPEKSETQSEDNPAPQPNQNRAVAIAVAAWYFQQKKANDLGNRLLEPRGEWWKIQK